MIEALCQQHGETRFEHLHSWTYSLMHQLRELHRDQVTLAPWASSSRSQVDPVVMNCGDEIAAAWKELIGSVDVVSSLYDLPVVCDEARTRLDELRMKVEHCSNSNRDRALRSLGKMRAELEQASQSAANLAWRYAEIARRSDATMEAMDFRFLFDENRSVFVIGHNVTEGVRDNSFYDLLASEARLASFIAIAKGDVPQKHWFRLGRGLTQVDGTRALISWTATMFEYLMPLLVMRRYSDTLLDQTNRAVVRRQIDYGKQRGVPWGVSESAYNARDLQLNYQYGPFGIPGLGLKRGLSYDLVVSPYSTALAAMVDPSASLDNMQRLVREGALTSYGFYEAIDYTRDRLKPNERSVLIKAFMVHHQGMILVSLDNLLNDNLMQRRFHSDPLVQSTELLLQERIPRGVALVRPRAEEVSWDGARRRPAQPDPRRFNTADLPTPRTQLLSNGTYSVVVTTAGSGYSACKGLAVTRWREDVT